MPLGMLLHVVSAWAKLPGCSASCGTSFQVAPPSVLRVTVILEVVKSWRSKKTSVWATASGVPRYWAGV